MSKKEKTPEKIQESYSKIMKQSSMQILLVPLLAIIFVIGALTDFHFIYKMLMLPIIGYILWFRLVIYRCPKCGSMFDRYQVYTYECKSCGTKFK